MPRPATRPRTNAGIVFHAFFQSLKSAGGEPLSVHEFAQQIGWARKNESQISGIRI